ncbi:hypothetical protein M2322_001236 [Rhodoblastus acidophilus]|uniref:hypothetical protein n=1 Tax=Rhodoblastus acidophilus TaxID=1074 RepID=UPI002224A953|nr:hypothetical protein [Rhodoblastus acidophilus]MCW2315702.1 hypothetical protein [Rhodoblastus acidophilus]
MSGIDHCAPEMIPDGTYKTKKGDLFKDSMGHVWMVTKFRTKPSIQIKLICFRDGTLPHPEEQQVIDDEIDSGNFPSLTKLEPQNDQ